MMMILGSRFRSFDLVELICQQRVKLTKLGFCHEGEKLRPSGVLGFQIFAPKFGHLLLDLLSPLLEEMHDPR